MNSVLLVPGFNGSGPDHWQSHWRRDHPEYLRLEQRDWEHPSVEHWVAALDTAIAQCGGSVVLVGHSLGCTTIAHWTERHGAGRVAGALLVAPADVEAATAPAEIRSFAPTPLLRLPYRSHVVTSTTDPLISMARAQAFATAWGSEITVLVDAGHINTSSGHGPWAEGHQMLEQLLVQGGRG